MPGIWNGRILLGGAFIGLAALAGTMLAHWPGSSTRPPVAPSSSAPARLAAAPAPAPSPAASVAAADQPFVIKHILPINGPIKYGEWHWDEAGVPPGPIVVTVDLDARVLSVFRDGYEIGAAAVLLGSQDKPTPTGVFPILEKQRYHESNLYDAKMPYMQRLTNDGITLHSAKVAWGYASHGCIGMPDDFAKKVFETTHVGDKVYITRGKMVGVGDNLTS